MVPVGVGVHSTTMPAPWDSIAGMNVNNRRERIPTTSRSRQMRIDKTSALIISPLLAGMLMLAGCGQRDATTASSQSSPPATTMGQKVDDAASKIADKATS